VTEVRESSVDAVWRSQELSKTAYPVQVRPQEVQYVPVVGYPRPPHPQEYVGEDLARAEGDLPVIVSDEGQELWEAVPPHLYQPADDVVELLAVRRHEVVEQRKARLSAPTS
jgi:hypothetical protein